ncbi:MAG: DNA-directed RNA polymerase subunit alpha [Endomicrobium sp.]|jgi:DNA-directed RNA polymerase subunit alpha|uniref:DNA-directed RNA polymerase subunit alpha n=1 Tax=Candidatus Endomicrobiellum cubanum TaxID=3242325 RepID=UPI0028348571|nr:DNA-directed RNA polymerase subunit alpha [Endomicrobium sp.]MDR2395397.1 DNA-directed RNA polymerase subunit alpha [Endomicrobium sp.]
MKAPDLEKLRKLVLDEKTSTSFYGCLTAAPFERGYGHTIGNSLRRVLLSSLDGAAITSVKVTGALHEFAVLKGVKEDVAQIVLNLKKIRVKLNSEGPERLYLKVKNPGKVTAKDIEMNPNVEIMNPEQEIAHIDNGTVLEMEMEVSMGRGYVLAEELKSSKDSVGTILLDSLFSPVTKVNYEVENTRVEQALNYDKLVIEIWTDGSIAPKDALIKSAKILRNSLVTFTGEPVESEEVVVEDSSVKENLEEGIFGQHISNMGLSTRASNSLKNASIETIGDLVKMKAEDILKLNNFGKRSFEEIKTKLEELNLTFGMEVKNGVKK